MSNILNRKDIPQPFRNQSAPFVCYSYTNTFARGNFNFKQALQDLSVEEYIEKPILKLVAVRNLLFTTPLAMSSLII